VDRGPAPPSDLLRRVEQHRLCRAESLWPGDGVGCPPGLDLPGIHFIELARGFGCDARRVDGADEFDTAFGAALEADGPTVLDVGVDPAIEALY